MAMWYDGIHSNRAPRQAQVTHTRAKEVVHVLVQTLKSDFRGFSVSDISEGGSLGHGTTVMSKYDMDLVIYSRDITGEEVYEKDGNYKVWLTEVDTFLRTTFRRDYRKSRLTLRCLKFRFRDTIDVTLFVSPNWTDQHQLYHFLNGIPKEKRDIFTACGSKWQVQFLKKQPAQVKELIRKAKEWRDREWPADRFQEGRPSSYLLSLLMVAAYERKPLDVTAALKTMVGSNTDQCWAGPGCFYEKRDYPGLLPPRPRVVDPANPANNVWVSGFKDCRPGETQSDHEVGNGRSSVFKAKMKDRFHTISLD